MDIVNPSDPQVIAHFERLCELEPRLQSLYDLLGYVRDNPAEPEFCAYLLWHGSGNTGGFNHRLRCLVGRRAGYPEPLPDILHINDLFPEFAAVCSVLSPADRKAIHREGTVRPSDFPTELTTRHSHLVAYTILVSRLPECRNCRCVGHILKGQERM